MISDARMVPRAHFIFPFAVGRQGVVRVELKQNRSNDGCRWEMGSCAGIKDSLEPILLCWAFLKSPGAMPVQQRRPEPVFGIVKLKEMGRELSMKNGILINFRLGDERLPSRTLGTNVR